MQPCFLQNSFSLRRLKFAAIPAIVILALAFVWPASGYAGFLDKALNFGKDLLAKAAMNYTSKYEQQLTQLLQSLNQQGTGSQPFIQGVTPVTPFNPNATAEINPYDPYGAAGSPYSNPYGGNPYGQNPAYDQGFPQSDSFGQFPGQSYPTNPNPSGYPFSNPYFSQQDQGTSDPYQSAPGYPQGGLSGQIQGSYPNNSHFGPNYGGYPQADQYGGAYSQLPNQGNQGYGAIPNSGSTYGVDPSGYPGSYGQAQGEYQQYNPNPGSPGYPSSSYPQQGGPNPYDQYGAGGEYGVGGYPGQPAPPAQSGLSGPYQPQGTYSPQPPGYAQPQAPAYPTGPGLQLPDQPAGLTSEGIQLDVALVKKTFVNGTETLLPVHDGDVLKDGRGITTAGDKFRIMFRANTDCYVYVIAIDGSAWAQGVFPSLTSPFANPVKQGKQYVLPEGNNWFSLDQFKGIETVFFVASPEKREDIEKILAEIAGRERHPKAQPQPVTEAPIIPAGFSRSERGTTPFLLSEDSSSDPGLIPTTYFTEKAGEALRITRWFRHQ